MADRTVSVKLKAEIDKYLQDLRRAGKSTDDLGKQVERAGTRSAQAIAGLPVAAAGASAATAAALGGVSAAFVGLGAVALRENEAVKSSFQDLSDQINTGLAQDAQPLADEFVSAADQIGAAYERLRPAFRDAFAASQPYVEDLTGSVTDFAETAMPGMVSAVESAGPVFDGLRQAANDMGGAVSESFEVFSQHAAEAGAGVEHFGSIVSGVMPNLAEILGTLTDTWAEHGDEVAQVLTQLSSLLADLGEGAFPTMADAAGVAVDTLGGILNVIEPMSDTIGPLIGTWISLAAAMRGMRAVGGVMESAALSMGNFAASSRRAAAGVGRFRGVARGVMGLLGGPWGIAITGAIGVLSAFAQTSQDTAGAQEALAQTLRDSGGEFNGQAREILAGGTRYQEAAEFVSQLGLSHQQFIDTIVEGGPALDQLKSRLDAMVNSGEIGIDQAAALNGAIREVSETASGGAEKAQVLAEASGETGNAMNQMGDQAANTAGQIDRMVESLNQATESAYAARSSEVSYQAAVDRASEAIANNGATLDVHTEQGRENRKALDNLAQSAVDHAGAMAQDGRSLNTVRGYMSDARGEFINMAIDMGRSTSEARRLANNLGLVPGNYTARVNIDVVQTLTRVGPMLGVDPFAGLGFARGGPVEGYADGGIASRVPGFPSGGVVHGPGSGTSDSIPARLSDGEFVVNAQATDKHQPLLEAINSGKFAQGGLVGGSGGGTAGGAVYNYYTVNAPNYVGSNEDLVRALRKEVRVKGQGSAQKALGS